MSNGQASRLAFLVPAVICLAVAVALLVPVSRRLGADMYWTPLEQAQTLDQTHDRVEVYLDGELLQRHAESGQLRLGDEAVSPDDVRVRMNNADQVLQTQLLIATGTAGAGLALLLAGLLLPRASRRR